MAARKSKAFVSTSDAFGQVDNGRVNWLGLYTLYFREVRRFTKVYFQTILAPVASTFLFMLVFTLAFGRLRGDVNNIGFAEFIAPGLIMMGMLTNAFANSSSSLISAKMLGNSVDYLMPPLDSFELTVAFVFGAATRGIVVGIASAFGIALYVGFDALSITHIWAVVYFAICASILLAGMGLIAGIWADKFDHLAAISNFFITPLTFLSGTFYSITVLPESLRIVSFLNPFFYLIDGFRFGFVGVSEANIWVGVLYCGGLCAATLIACYIVLRTGWRLKS